MTHRTKISSRVALVVEVDHRNFIMTFHEEWYRVERSGQLLKAKEFDILVIGARVLCLRTVLFLSHAS